MRRTAIILCILVLMTAAFWIPAFDSPARTGMVSREEEGQSLPQGSSDLSAGSGAFPGDHAAVSNGKGVSEAGLPELLPVNVRLDNLRQLVPALTELAGGAAYRVAEGVLDGFPQKLHVLVVDPGAASIAMRPVLSFDRLFGYETLSVMAERADALAAVNGGFSFLDGRPAGTVLVDGEFWHPSDKRFPTLLMGETAASLTDLDTRVSVVLAGKPAGSAMLNPFPLARGVSLFTPAFGRMDRSGEKRVVVTVSGGVVTKVSETAVPEPIPEDGFLLEVSGASAELPLRAVSAGMSASWEVACTPVLPAGTLHAMSCGSWLVRNGKQVVPASDPWVGSLAGQAPRTVVGIGSEGQLVFLVAEGRIPDGPAGLSGKDMETLLPAMGLLDAALLDGGASSGLRIGDNVVNRLSAGRERLLPAGFVLVRRPEKAP